MRNISLFLCYGKNIYKRKNMCFFLFGQGPKSGFLQHDFIRYIIHCSAGEKQHMAEQYNLILTKDFLYLL